MQKEKVEKQKRLKKRKSRSDFRRNSKKENQEEILIPAKFLLDFF